MNTSFEDRLLAELREVVESRPAPAREPSARRTPPRRVGLTLGAGAALAAVGAAAVVLAGGGSDTPAYAVERQDDGTVTVDINNLRDADGLERKLRAAGVPAEVDYTPEDKTCRSPRGKPADGPHTMGMRGRDDGSARLTIPRGDVKPGETVVISTSVGEHLSSIGIEIVDGPVAACELIDATAVPALPAGSANGPEKRASSGGGGTAFPSRKAGPPAAGGERSPHTGP